MREGCSLGDTAVTGRVGPALVELLPRVLHDSPAAMLLVDLVNPLLDPRIRHESRPT